MAEIILHHNGAYNMFSTIVDAPIFKSALTLEQLTQYIKEEYGRTAVEELPRRLERAHAKGTSAIYDDSLADTISANRSGPNEKRLSTKAFIAQFLTLTNGD